MSTHRSSRRPVDVAPEKLVTILSIVFFGVAVLVFCLLGGVYAYQVIEDLRSDSFEFAIGSSWGINWHRSFSVKDHPLLFAARMSIDVTGAVGAFGIGLLLLGVLISISTKMFDPLFKRVDRLIKPFAVASAGTFGAHFVFTLVPYLLAIIDKSA